MLSFRKPKRVAQNKNNDHKIHNNNHNYHDEIKLYFIMIVVIIKELVKGTHNDSQQQNNIHYSQWWGAHIWGKFKGHVVIFRVTGPLCGEFTGDQWIPTKASDAELGCFFFMCAWTKGWLNNRGTGDLRSHRAHYVVTVILWSLPLVVNNAKWLIHSTLNSLRPSDAYMRQ